MYLLCRPTYTLGTCNTYTCAGAEKQGAKIQSESKEQQREETERSGSREQKGGREKGKEGHLVAAAVPNLSTYFGIYQVTLKHSQAGVPSEWLIPKLEVEISSSIGLDG